MIDARLPLASFAVALLFAGGASAAMTYGAHDFGSERHCASTGKLPADICAIAAANAAAEFEEKAPRFAARDACERVFRGGCSVGFRGAGGFAGRPGGVFFSPRQQGYRVTVKSDHDARVTPLGAGAGFSARSALTRDTAIHPHGSRDYVAPTHASAPRGAVSGNAGFGVATPDGPKSGALPPRPPTDPNFDCASVIEPGADPATACALAPARRR